MQDLVDQHLRERKETPAMQAVMGGTFAQQIICKSVSYRSEKEEDFYQVPALGRTLPSSLRLHAGSAGLLQQPTAVGRCRLCGCFVKLKTPYPAGAASGGARNIQLSCVLRGTVQISLDVRGKRCLEESLDFYCQGELMEGDNQYFCEQAGKKVGVVALPFAAWLPCCHAALERKPLCLMPSLPVTGQSSNMSWGMI